MDEATSSVADVDCYICRFTLVGQFTLMGHHSCEKILPLGCLITRTYSSHGHQMHNSHCLTCLLCSYGFALGGFQFGNLGTIIPKQSTFS
jgi:hypothetical protein